MNTTLVQTARLEAEMELLSQQAAGGLVQAAAFTHKAPSGSMKASSQHVKLSVPSNVTSPSATPLRSPRLVDVIGQTVVGSDFTASSKRKNSQDQSKNGAHAAAMAKSMVHSDSAR
jgi:hypothetical protein